MALLKIGRGSHSFNYYVIRGVLDNKAVAQAQSVAKTLPQIEGAIYSRSVSNQMHSYLDRMPHLVNTLRHVLDDFSIIGTNFFCSEPSGSDWESHGEWHTGHSIYFGLEKGDAMTLWIPLQELNDKTGGRLKLYNGNYISQIDDLLNCQVKKTGNSISNRHCILNFLNHELNDNAHVENMVPGDILLFDEMLPHQAEKCLINRDVLVLRIIVGEYSINKPLVQQVLDRYANDPSECDFAGEFLENLLKFEQYYPPGSPQRGSD